MYKAAFLSTCQKQLIKNQKSSNRKQNPYFSALIRKYRQDFYYPLYSVCITQMPSVLRAVWDRFEISYNGLWTNKKSYVINQC
jgi:hypothetical protein